MREISLHLGQQRQPQEYLIPNRTEPYIRLHLPAPRSSLREGFQERWLCRNFKDTVGMTSVFSRKGAKSSAGGCACREVGWGSVSPHATHLHIGSFNFPEVTKIQGPIYMLTSWKHTSLLPPLPVIAVRDQCVCWLICLFLP